MTLIELVDHVAQEEVSLLLTPLGTLKIAGPDDAVSRWLPALSANKVGIVESLRALAAVREWLTRIGKDQATIHTMIEQCRKDEAALECFLNRSEAFEERAAILEFDAGLSREEAERRAASCKNANH